MSTEGLKSRLRAHTGRLATKVTLRVRPHAGLDTRIGHHLAQIRAMLPPSPTPYHMPAVIDAFARTVSDARVLQIGANDGQDYDPLRRHLRRGRWHAWLLEPVPDIHARLVANTRFLPRVTALNLAVGPEDGILPFYRVTPAAPGEDVPPWYDKVGSFDRTLIEGLSDLWAPIVDRIEETEVECVTLATLLERYPIGTPDLLNIDAEGFDGEILAQMHDVGLAPGVIVYEHSHLGDDEETTVERLRAAGYRSFVEGMDTLAVHERLLRGDTPLVRAFDEATS